MTDEISRLKAIDPERVDTLVQETLAEMDPWMRRLLLSTDPFKSRLLRVAVLARAGERRPPAPTDDPQLTLALSDQPVPPAVETPRSRSRAPNAVMVKRPKIVVKV